MDKTMSSALMADFSSEAIGHKPATWCRQCAETVRGRQGKSCKDHKVAWCPKCRTTITEAHTCLDFVGHADVRARLCEVDPEWSWAPFEFPGTGSLVLSADGQPVGLWIMLTVGGVSKPGYGSVDKGKAEAVKELIGDCLLRGTPVQTERGIVPIEEVRPGDLVPTREGWRRVADHWLSHPAAPTKAVLLADGKVIVGTPHHRIPTANRGVQCIEALRNGDMLYAWQDTARTQAQTRSSGMGAATGGSPTIPTGIAASISWRLPRRAPISTLTSTKRRTGQSPMAGMSITATLTRLTMNPETSSPSHRKITPSGTASTWSPMSVDAMSADSPTKQSADGAAGVLLLARNAGGAATGLPTSDPARDLSASRAFAKNAGLTTSPAVPGRASVLVPVVSVLDAGPGEVWNLSVEGVHEYTANGLIVHNSLRNAGQSFGIAWKLWAKGERTGGEHESATDAADDAAPANGNGNRGAAANGRTVRPANGNGEPAAPATSAEPDPDAQVYADEAQQARTLAVLKDVNTRAREAHKLASIIRDPATGKTGGLGQYIGWRKKQLEEDAAALAEFTTAITGMSTDVAEGHMRRICGTGIEDATAAQLRQAAQALTAGVSG